MDLAQIGAQEGIQSSPYIEFRFVLPARMSDTWNWLVGRSLIVVQLAYSGFDLHVAFGDPRLDEVIELELMA